MTNLTRKDKPGRLKSRPDFLAVQKGLRLRGPYFLLEMLDRRKPDEAPRVGFTVTRKQGNAVERNRMRRRLREVVRLIEGVSFRPGHDYVLVARREALTAPFANLGQALSARLEEGHRKISDPASRTAGGRGNNQLKARGPKRSGTPGTT